MTTPQPAALPELLTDTDVARIFRRVYGGTQFDSTERMFAAEIEAAVRERLAALQPQPAAAVSDAEIDWVASQHTRSVDTPTRFVTDVRATVRAILALRPQAVPMTPGQMRTLVVDCGYDHASTQERADFINGVRTGERWHRITAQGAQGGEG